MNYELEIMNEKPNFEMERQYFLIAQFWEVIPYFFKNRLSL